jgi:hypothetical protein
LLHEVIGRAFGGRADKLDAFVAALESGLPDGTTICLRGSAVNGCSYKTGEPFDADGPGTSDLDVVVIGEAAANLWADEARLLGGINTLPLDDEAAWVAPALDPARRRAQSIVGRPVAVQAMAEWFLDVRGALQDQQYVTLAAPAG